MHTYTGPAIPLSEINFLAVLTQVNKDASTELFITASLTDLKDGNTLSFHQCGTSIEL